MGEEQWGHKLWKFNDASWEQDDKACTFRLKLLFGRTYTAKPSAPLGKLIGAKSHKAALPDMVCAQGTFPAEFTFCPYCGEELVAPVEYTIYPWIPPYGNGSGLKVITGKHRPENLVTEICKLVALPSINGRFSFCSALLGAKQRLLIALQRDVGKISVYQPDSVEKWHELDDEVGEDDLPEWSWSLATDEAETGVAIPCKDGPAWITINWVNNKLNIDRGAGRSVGGVARLGKFLLAPVLRGNNFFMLYRKSGDSKWSECRTSSNMPDIVSLLRHNEDQLACFGVPVVSKDQFAYWSCRSGYIKVSGCQSVSKLAWEFSPWGTDATPPMALIELGPPYSKIGAHWGFWQLCEDKDPSRRGQMINKIIKLDGDKNTDSEVLNYGQFVSTGRASFTRLHDFWNDVHKRDTNEGVKSDLRYPLLQFGDEGLVLLAKASLNKSYDDKLFSDIFFNRQEKMSAHMRFVVEGSGTAEKALYVEDMEASKITGSLFKVMLAHLPELSVFIYDASLYIYLPDSNKCYRWPLELRVA